MVGKLDGSESGSWGTHRVLIPEPVLAEFFPAVMPVFNKLYYSFI